MPGPFFPDPAAEAIRDPAFDTSAYSADIDGGVIELLKYLISNSGSGIQRMFGLPGRLRPPVDHTVVGTETLTEPISYFKNLVVPTGTNLVAPEGGGIIVVEEQTTIVGTGKIHANALGAKYGAPVNDAAVGGHGGGIVAYTGTNIARSTGAWLGATNLVNPFTTPWAFIQSLMAAGGVGGYTAANAATAGSSWYATAGLPWTGTYTVDVPSDLALFQMMIAYLISPIRKVDATYGAIGGGAGGQGARPTASDAAVSGPAGGTAGGQGASGTLKDQGAGGGSGFGGGGGGGGTNGGVGSVSAVRGGRGGGVLALITGILDNGNIISSDGEAGGASSGSRVGAGGGGGGGFAGVAYNELTGSGLGTVRALGGAAGTNGSANTSDAAAGGTGLAISVKLRSGS